MDGVSYTVACRGVVVMLDWGEVDRPDPNRGPWPAADKTRTNFLSLPLSLSLSHSTIIRHTFPTRHRSRLGTVATKWLDPSSIRYGSSWAYEGAPCVNRCPCVVRHATVVTL